MINTVEAAAFAVFWTAAAALAITGTMFEDMRLMLWALMVSLVSMAGTVHIIVSHVVRRERLDVERLADAVLARALEQAEVERPRLIKR